MAKPCSICIGQQRTAIDNALSSGAEIKAVAARYGASKSAVGRHKLTCLAPRLAAAARLVAPASTIKAETTRAVAIASGQAAPTLGEAISYSGLVDTLTRSLERLERAADDAASDKAIAALAAVSGQLHKAVETAAKLCGLNKEKDPGSEAPRYSLTIRLGSDRNETVIEGRSLPAAAVVTEASDETLATGVGDVVPRSHVPLRVPDFGAAPDADKSGQFSFAIKSSAASPG